MGVRLYQPAIGRFLQQDPVEGGSCNDFDYVCADPMNGFDLDGNLILFDGRSLNDWRRRAQIKLWLQVSAAAAYTCAGRLSTTCMKVTVHSHSTNRSAQNAISKNLYRDARSDMVFVESVHVLEASGTAVGQVAWFFGRHILCDAAVPYLLRAAPFPAQVLGAGACTELTDR